MCCLLRLTERKNASLDDACQRDVIGSLAYGLISIRVTATFQKNVIKRFCGIMGDETSLARDVSGYCDICFVSLRKQENLKVCEGTLHQKYLLYLRIIPVKIGFYPISAMNIKLSKG